MRQVKRDKQERVERSIAERKECLTDSDIKNEAKKNEENQRKDLNLLDRYSISEPNTTIRVFFLIFFVFPENPLFSHLKICSYLLECLMVKCQIS
ncbi:hypothetical protein BpHYR1_021357 [Brachionus plicatilis]|uniref:Uncharacterized protein n=1 Tax=Brachionus plicatilis TaxID=10195 RepID=A0A3M7Q8R5_BRAPC|nr:hypothetical protein BpHYR1_021357 [Brachionus plicatilis]